MAESGRVIVIQRRLPSQNKSHYRHWSHYRKERDAWFVLLRAQLPPQHSAEVPVAIALRSYRTRLVDYANLVGGAKMVPDCLITLGYLKDDAPQWFRCSYEQFQVPKAEERTEIEFLDW
ncbi:MAG: hypothetical protein PF961_23130 [Planctomycetota bacterium]|jgi:hypothetical protein|nr:hypothetical protein [Planctomycetota bacterium]